MKKLFTLITLCLFSIVSAMAETTTIYERGTTEETAWSAADIATSGNYVWGGNAEITTKGYPYVSGNGGRTSSMKIVKQQGSILTYDAVWFTGGDGSNATNYTYFRLCDKIEFQAHTTNQVGNVVINGTSYTVSNACKKDINRTDDEWTIHAEINTASNTLTALTVAGKNGTKKASFSLPASVSLGTTDYSTLTFATYREKYMPYCGVISLKIQETTQDVATADYTINYKLGDNTVKQVTGNTTVGSTVNADASFVKDDVKYFATSSTLSMTIASGTNTLDVEVREAALYDYAVVAKDGESTMGVIAHGSSLEGDNVTVAYPQYYLTYDGRLLSANHETSGDWYCRTFTPNADKYEEKIAYTNNVIDNVVFYTEAEDIAGVTVANYTNRASNGKVAHTGGADIFKEVTTLAPGKYKITVKGLNGNNANRICYFSVADKKVFTFVNPQGTNNGTTSLEIPVYSESTLKFSSEGSSSSGVDLFYVVKTGEAPAGPTLNGSGYATFSESVHVQITGAKVYKGKLEGTTLTCTEIESGLVPAGTGVILCGEAGATVTVTNVAEAPAIEDNDIIATTMADTDIRAVETNAFVLSGNTFRKYAGEAFAPNKAYILYSEVTEGKLTLVFNDDATAAAVVEADAVVAPTKYVNAKGQLIIGGKYNALGQQMK